MTTSFVVGTVEVHRLQILRKRTYDPSRKRYQYGTLHSMVGCVSSGTYGETLLEPLEYEVRDFTCVV